MRAEREPAARARRGRRAARRRRRDASGGRGARVSDRMAEPIDHVPVVAPDRRSRPGEITLPEVFDGPVRAAPALRGGATCSAPTGAPARTRPRRARSSRGGGKKPWRQKGTGRARAGSIALADLGRRRDHLRPAAARLLATACRRSARRSRAALGARRSPARRRR